MTERSIAHGHFTVKRSYPHPIEKVFRAWSDPAIKRQWYGGDGQDEARAVFEFRNGGREFSAGKGPDGEPYAFEIRYYDIVPENRIVYAYDVRIADVLTSVSIATVAFTTEGAETAVSMTEHGAFLDGHDSPDERIGGTEWVLDALAKVLDAQ